MNDTVHKEPVWAIIYKPVSGMTYEERGIALAERSSPARDNLYAIKINLLNTNTDNLKIARKQIDDHTISQPYDYPVTEAHANKNSTKGSAFICTFGGPGVICMGIKYLQDAQKYKQQVTTAQSQEIACAKQTQADIAAGTGICFAAVGLIACIGAFSMWRSFVKNSHLLTEKQAERDKTRDEYKQIIAQKLELV